MIELISVMDNAPSSDPTLCSEHALSAYLNYHGTKILFDAGQSEQTWKNTAKLGLDLSDLSAIILSHAHYDHAAALRTFPGEPAGKTIYLGQKFFDPKYSQTDDEKIYIGSHLDRDYLNDQGYSVIEVKEDIRQRCQAPKLLSYFRLRRCHLPLQVASPSVAKLNSSVFEPDKQSAVLSSLPLNPARLGK